MSLRVASGCVAVCLICPALSFAQVSEPAPTGLAAATAQAPTLGGSVNLPPGLLFPTSASATSSEKAPGFWQPFQSVPGDFVRFFSTDTMRVVGLGAAGALVAHQWDNRGIEASQRHLHPTMFKPGNLGGGLLTQAGASFALYSVAKLTGSEELAAVGGDLVRAQLLSQGIVQAGKFSTRRSRPDSSNNHSLPSGHTAAAFATATVLRDHYGWKVGVPAYGFGAYVAASRMSANKHHLSDVAIGAAIGIAAGRTVTLGSGSARFRLGLAPARGGAAITFTKH